MTRQKAIDVLSLLLFEHKIDPIFNSLIKPKDLAAALRVAIKTIKEVR